MPARKPRSPGDRPADGPFTHNIAHGFVYKRVPHVTLKSIANNAEIDVIWDKHQPGVERLRADLNAAVQLYVDTLPTKDRPAWTPWEEWQVPRPPVFPWDERCQKLHARILDLKAERAELEDDDDTTDEILAKQDRKFAKPLKDLNTLLGRSYTLDKLPEHAGDPLPAAALPLHEAFWTARRARQAEIDDSIARNADTEFLYDQPYEDKGTVRVAGPFTVESLSPHRVLAATDEDPSLLAAIRDDDAGDHRITAPRHRDAAHETGAARERRFRPRRACRTWRRPASATPRRANGCASSRAPCGRSPAATSTPRPATASTNTDETRTRAQGRDLHRPGVRHRHPPDDRRRREGSRRRLRHR